MSKKLSFEQLQTKWYEKLKKSGFDDIETSDRKFFRHSYAPYQGQATPVHSDVKLQYYQMATKFLHDYKFANRREEVIWAYHSEGISVRNIVILLKKAKMPSAYRTGVWKTVSKLRKSMVAMYLTAENENEQ